MMRTILSVALLSLFIVVVALQAARAAEPLRSSLQAGERITSIFEPLNVTGPHAGEPYCQVCENGANPVAMIFARQDSPALAKLVAKIDEAAAKHSKQQLGSFVVFLSEEKGLPGRLKELAKKHSLKQVVLCTDKPEGPDGFNVAKEADVTVVLYREHLVKANHAFKKGELTDEASQKILADLPKILAEK